MVGLRRGMPPKRAADGLSPRSEMLAGPKSSLMPWGDDKLYEKLLDEFGISSDGEGAEEGMLDV